MSSVVEISDDDESIEEVEIPKIQGLTNNHKQIVSISSDEDDSNLTSDEDISLPKVNIIRTNAIKNLFPAKPSTSNDRINVRELPGTGPSTRHVSTSLSVPSAPKLPGFEMFIGGIKIQLPVKPYSSQTALMFKVITAIKKGQNCLLESPTGSGKTLALLCGALAWQHQEGGRIAQLQAQEAAQQHPQLMRVEGAMNYITSPQKLQNHEDIFSKSVFGERSIYDKPLNGIGDGEGASKRPEPMDCDDPDDLQDGQVTIHKKRKLGSPSTSSSPEYPTTPKKPIQVEQPETPENLRQIYKLLHQIHLRTSMYVDCSVPTIYYGARTHKQLQQVIKEFSRTCYCGLANMTVLSSREYSCIREFDRKLWASKNDMCRGCTKKNLSVTDQKEKGETNCSFYNNRESMNHNNMPPAFDLEDLVAIGTTKQACPYYAARDMAKTAQIVFCPYNYLIDPGIRSSMQIDLSNNIVIIDEAHNIEDICRDAATFTITWDNVTACLLELEKAAMYRYSNTDATNFLDYLHLTLRNWDQWFQNQKALVQNVPVNGNEAVYSWQIQHFIETLNNHNIGIRQYNDFKEAAELFCRKLRESPETLRGVTQSTGSLVESIAVVFGYIFDQSGRYKDDFKPAIIRTVYTSEISEARAWRNSQFQQSIEKETLSLRLLCLNPAVVFEGLKTAKCIILASGTLTPLVSLHSELATEFPLQVSLNHNISADRVWIGTLTTCPDGSPLDCSSRGSKQPHVQDALGLSVLHVCNLTPHGVLCFMPSYTLCNKLLQRWKETGLWDKLTDLKQVFMESRNARDHNDIMDEYYKYVNTPKGALLFAVYRGKVSEGMDFKDHQARAVITIGVPYPNLGDMAVKEKMSYNDKYKEERNLLSSGEWLRVQAYRALNQAVGRCVRHSQDWGAVLMVDSRLTSPYYTEHLSRWVRSFLGNNHHTLDSLTNSDNSLKNFMQHMSQEDV